MRMYQVLNSCFFFKLNTWYIINPRAGFLRLCSYRRNPLVVQSIRHRPFYLHVLFRVSRAPTSPPPRRHKGKLYRSLWWQNKTQLFLSTHLNTFLVCCLHIKPWLLPKDIISTPEYTQFPSWLIFLKKEVLVLLARMWSQTVTPENNENNIKINGKWKCEASQPPMRVVADHESTTTEAIRKRQKQQKSENTIKQNGFWYKTHKNDARRGY